MLSTFIGVLVSTIVLHHFINIHYIKLMNNENKVTLNKLPLLYIQKKEKKLWEVNPIRKIFFITPPQSDITGQNLMTRVH